MSQPGPFDPGAAPLETVLVLAQLINVELGFGVDSGRVMIGNQKFRIPDFEGMFVSVSYLSGAPAFGSKLKYVDGEDENQLYAIQSANVQEIISIKCYSANGEARMRNHEIVWALNSNYSQQLQEENAFKIATLPSSFVDTSQLEAAAILNRFDATINVLRKYSRKTLVPSYNQFQNPPKTLLVNP